MKGCIDQQSGKFLNHSMSHARAHALTHTRTHSRTHLQSHVNMAILTCAFENAVLRAVIPGF